MSHELKFVFHQSHLPDFDLLFLTDGGYFLGAIRIHLRPEKDSAWLRNLCRLIGGGPGSKQEGLYQGWGRHTTGSTLWETFPPRT